MLDEEAGFACGEGEKIGFMHFVHQLMPCPTVPAPLRQEQFKADSRAAALCLEVAGRMGPAGKTGTLCNLSTWGKPSGGISWPQHCVGGSDSGRTLSRFSQH